ncbi:MAG: ABC transporter permease [Oscillibacter sp.]|nr:ABC transporter permease [Oscillibacter sp.]
MKKNDNGLSLVLLRGWAALRQPLIAIVFGLLIGAIIIVACGESPLMVYAEMFQKSFIKPYYLFSTLVRSTPVIICAMAVGISWRAGYINLGVEGQMITGAFISTVVALFMPGPSFLVAIVAWVLGMAAGAAYALIPAILTWKFNVSMVITTLMMNYVASYITSYFVTYPLKDTAGDGLSIQTPEIAEALRLPRLSSTTTFNAGFIIAIAVVVLILFISRKTIFGYESKMGGFNPTFAQYGGTKQVKVMMITMALAGAIACVAGNAEVFGLKYRYTDGMLSTTSYAWTGLQSALIAGLDPIGMTVVAIFLSGLQIGGSAIQRSMGIPLEIANIIQCCITLFVSVKITIRFVKKSKAAAKEGGKQA